MTKESDEPTTGHHPGRSTAADKNEAAQPASAKLSWLPLALPTGPPAGRRTDQLRVLGEPVRLIARHRQLRAAPTGDGHVVVTVPGYGVSDWVSAPLRRYLQRLGYTARGWGLGRNRGDPEADAARLAPRIEAIAAEHGPVTLVGWSLGGVVAREAARNDPDNVRSVVMFGSPVIGGPTHTILHGIHSAAENAEIAARAEQLDRERPLAVPVTSIYSQRDGVVNWLSCIDRYTPDARHVEVGGSHVGLLLDPDVWLAVAAAIARH